HHEAALGADPDEARGIRIGGDRPSDGPAAPGAAEQGGRKRAWLARISRDRLADPLSLVVLGYVNDSPAIAARERRVERIRAGRVDTDAENIPHEIREIGIDGPR